MNQRMKTQKEFAMRSRTLLEALPVLGLLLAALVSTPSAEAANIRIGDDPSLGSRDAKLVLVEFADYQ